MAVNGQLAVEAAAEKAFDLIFMGERAQALLLWYFLSPLPCLLSPRRLLVPLPVLLLLRLTSLLTPWLSVRRRANACDGRLDRHAPHPRDRGAREPAAVPGVRPHGARHRGGPPAVHGRRNGRLPVRKPNPYASTSMHTQCYAEFFTSLRRRNWAPPWFARSLSSCVRRLRVRLNKHM